MPDFKKIAIDNISSFYDSQRTYAFVTEDKNYLRTTLVLYVAVNAGHEIDFADIETTADIGELLIGDKDPKILRKYYRDDLAKDPDIIREYKKKVMAKHKDWRKIKYSSEFTFQAKVNLSKAAYTQFYKFQLPGIEHNISKFVGQVIPSV